MKKFLIKCHKAQDDDHFWMKPGEGFFVLFALGLANLENTVLSITPRGYRVPRKATLSKKVKLWGVLPGTSMFGQTMFEIKEIDHIPEVEKKFVYKNEGRNFSNELILVANKEWNEKSCRVCGCTDLNCIQCYRAQGYPCHWVEEDLCSRCDNELKAKQNAENPIR